MKQLLLLLYEQGTLILDFDAKVRILDTGQPMIAFGFHAMGNYINMIITCKKTLFEYE